MIKMVASLLLGSALTLAAPGAAAGPGGLKGRAIAGVEARTKLAQEINDSIFSFSELGFQEVETSRYLTDLLEKNGFTVERGTSGLPTGWVARWSHGSGGPVIALGSDIDGIPKASQKPGIPWREPMVEGAPGHGEGHNSGQAVNVVAALAVKDLMERENIAGTLVLWPGVAEELVSGKAFMVRDGVFKDVDEVIFTHVSNNLGTAWGAPSGTGLVSVEYTFAGESAHSAGAPWRGKSALDAVELMNVAWNMRREHLRAEQRSHYVITDGGDQPNVVPSRASVWYYFREQDFKGIARNFAIGNTIADAAAAMTDTKVTRRILGTAAPRHFNKPMAEAAYANIKAVGLPAWTDDEQAFARAVQKSVAAEKQEGLAKELDKFEPPLAEPKSGGSDDIGDVSWVVPTITIGYPSNIPELPGHNWSNAIAMATPIAHKGVVAGSKVVAMTVIDLLTKPKLRQAAKDYFANVQTKDQKYEPMLSATDTPPIDLNRETMARYKPELRKYYYDPARYPTYLDQLGIKFPTLEKPGAAPASD
ncbi:amidohydrolase [Allosphingosinicella deserti]|uniref:Amidohydrolase n=1 Tax=Allosphingosinicella deserti TaxID=2116704 RepID=A0A2P7QS60_9SPHN|nr:amidohydrolase [Sphingomonas deserti]